jgi:hypothetical protein
MYLHSLFKNSKDDELNKYETEQRAQEAKDNLHNFPM